MFEELKTFISVVELKNFTKAATSLNLSQPSVSTHIKNLENHFGVVLINRSVKQKNIIITESGWKLYSRAKEILNLLDVTYSELHNIPDTIGGTLKIGASLTIGECILPKFLSYFLKKYPYIDVEVCIKNTSSICSYVKNLSVDLGLIEGLPTVSNINQDYFFEDSLVLAYPATENLLRNKISIENLQNKDWIVREEGSGTREYLNLFLAQNKITPKSITVLSSNYAVKEAVKAGLGITVISSLVIKSEVKNKELNILPLDESFNRHYSCIVPNNINKTEACNIFIKEMLEFFRNMK